MKVIYKNKLTNLAATMAKSLGFNNAKMGVLKSSNVQDAIDELTGKDNEISLDLLNIHTGITGGSTNSISFHRYTDFPGYGAQNSNKEWLANVVNAMPVFSTYTLYNPSGIEWQYVITRGTNLCTVIRSSHQAELQVCAANASDNGVFTPEKFTNWRRATMTDVGY